MAELSSPYARWCEALEERLKISAAMVRRMALMRRGRPRDLIEHSDRGSQYCAQEYRALLSETGLLCSMSARGDCYHDAAMEAGTTARRSRVHGERFVTRPQAK